MKLKTTTHQLPTAVVIGIDDVRGVYAARTLARHRVPVVGIANDPKSYGARSRAVQRTIVADTNGRKLIDALQALGARFGQKAILVPCMDMTVITLSQHWDRLDRWYRVALPPPDVVELMTDKIKFYTFAQQHDLPIPETHFLYSRNDALRVAEKATFPCAVKPPNSKSPRWLSRTHLKAFKANNGDHLLSLYDEYSPHADALIAQRWIEGTDENHFTCNCYFDFNGRPLVSFVSRKIRQWPPSTGEGCLSVECRNDGIVEATLRVFQNLQFHGLGYVEFKRDAVSGEQLIIEPNICRPTGRCALAEGSGVELLYTMYCELADLPLPEKRDQQFRGVKWVFLRRDLMSALYYWRKGELSLYDWYKSLRGRKVYALLSFTDPVPFFADLIRAARLVLTRG